MPGFEPGISLFPVELGDDSTCDDCNGAYYGDGRNLLAKANCGCNCGYQWNGVGIIGGEYGADLL